MGERGQARLPTLQGRQAVSDGISRFAQIGARAFRWHKAITAAACCAMLVPTQSLQRDVALSACSLYSDRNGT